MKKIYLKPEVRVVKLQRRLHLLQDSYVQSVNGNVFSGFSSDKDYNGDARSRGFDDWDDDCDE